VKNQQSQGPFVVPFTGAVDAVGIMLRGEQGALDNIRVRGR
jgi:hypothetical protein